MTDYTQIMISAVFDQHKLRPEFWEKDTSMYIGCTQYQLYNGLEVLQNNCFVLDYNYDVNFLEYTMSKQSNISEHINANYEGHGAAWNSLSISSDGKYELELKSDKKVELYTFTFDGPHISAVSVVSYISYCPSI